MPSSNQEYSQQNIYVQNSIRSRLYDFTPAYSEMIGRLCAVEGSLAQRESAAGICDELLAVFKGQAPYSSVDRICLAMRVGFSNELFVVDSCNSYRAKSEVEDENANNTPPPNIMSPGYRCFVRPQSSVLNLREGEVRLYDDATRIADAFEKKDKPIQRSLVNILKMGFKSGACLPLHVAGELRGFLFLNSVEEGLFAKLSDEDYAVLNFISMIGKLGVIAEGTIDTEYIAIKNDLPLPFASTLFDADEFAKHLQTITRHLCGDNWNPQIELVGDNNFLYSPANLAFATFKIASEFHATVAAFPKKIRVENLDDGEVAIKVGLENAEVPELEKYRALVKRLENRYRFLKISLRPRINDVALCFPFDPVSRTREDIFYSV